MRYLVLVMMIAMLMVGCVLNAGAFSFSIPHIPGLGNGANNSSDSSKITSVIGNVLKANKEISEPQEISIGREFSATLLGAKPLVADARLQRYVNALGRWLSMHTDRPDLPWTFAVLDDPTYNAFATPGGHIFVTKGLIDHMHNEAELAGVLGHEIGHVLMKHHLHAMQKSGMFGALVDSVDLFTQGGNAQIKSMTKNAIKNLYITGLDKEDEYQADRIGVVIAARAGYDPYGLPSVLQMLESQSSKDGNFSMIFKTHPSPADRIEKLDGLMKDRFDQTQGSLGLPLKERLLEFPK